MNTLQTLVLNQGFTKLSLDEATKHRLASNMGGLLAGIGGVAGHAMDPFGGLGIPNAISPWLGAGVGAVGGGA